MKLFVVVLFAVAGLAAAENTDIDWSKVRPVYEFQEWQDAHPGHMQLLEKMNFAEKLQKIKFGPGGRIVGGQEAQRHQFPYQLGLVLNMAGGQGWCGGSLISQNYGMSAAHCLDTGVNSAIVLLGAHMRTENEPQQQRISVPSANFRLYPGWNAANIRNDLAVFRLTEPANYNLSYIRSVRLPNWGQVGQTFAGQLGRVSGWGRFQDSSQDISEWLRFVELPIITNLACRTRWPTLITDAHICADGANGGGPCQGDSGGPLSIVEGDGITTQVGVVSFGLGFGCELNWPSAYLRVTSYLDWIEDNTDREIAENW